MVQGTKEQKLGKWGRREKYVFLRFSASWGVSKQRGAIKKQREEEVGEQGALPLAQALINTRPPDRKWPGQLIAPGELPSGVETMEEFSTQENEAEAHFISRSTTLVPLSLQNAIQNTPASSCCLTVQWKHHSAMPCQLKQSPLLYRLSLLPKIPSWTSIEGCDVGMGNSKAGRSCIGRCIGYGLAGGGSNRDGSWKTRGQLLGGKRVN